MEDLQEKKQAIRKDLRKLKSIEAILTTEGGEILVASLKRDIRDSLDTVLSLYKAPELELRSAVCRLKERLDMLRVLKRAPKNVKLLEEELALILVDVPDEEN